MGETNDFKGILSCNRFSNAYSGFKLKVVRNALSIKDNSTRELVHDLFEKLVDDVYDWHKPYSWQELKALLFYFILFRQANHPEAVLAVMKQDGYGKTFRKYLRGKE